MTVNHAHAKTGFQYSQRIAAEIPAIAGLYSHMSGISHGESLHISSALETPAAIVRTIGYVTARSVEAWSVAVHALVDVEPAPFLNPDDMQHLVDSMPAAHREEFEADNRARRTQESGAHRRPR